MPTHSGTRNGTSNRKVRQQRRSAAPEHYVLAGWGNTLTQAGFADKSAHSRALPTKIYSASELEALYSGDALARRIVDRPADDSVREGFTFADLPKGVEKRLEVLEDGMRRYGVMQALCDADKAARLYGGALLIPLTEGDGKPSTPLNIGAVTNLRGFDIVAAPDARADIQGVASPRQYLYPEYYTVYGSERIHASRCIRFDGALIPLRMLYLNNYWHLSVLNAPYKSLRRLGIVRSYIEALVHNVSVSVLKINGLGKKLMGTADAREKAKKAVRELQNQIDNLHWLALDKEDSFDVSSRPLQGLNELEARCFEAVLADQDLPREILSQATPGGLNSGNTGPLEQYYATVHSGQVRRYEPALGMILPIVFSLLRMRVKSYTLDWRELWRPTAKESADTRKVNADADRTYVDMGAATPQQIGAARIADGTLPPPEPGAAPAEPADEPPPLSDE